MKTARQQDSKSSRPQLAGLFMALLLAASALSARADNTIWTGNGDGQNWFDGNNWNSGIPNYSVNAFINNGRKAGVNTPGAVAQSLTLGAYLGNSGAVSVDGSTGGTLSTSQCAGDGSRIGGAIYVGQGGSGTLSITNGGKVFSELGYIASVANPLEQRASNGMVTVDGAGSTWTIGTCNDDYRLFVGASEDSHSGGTAVLNITNGGAVVVNDQTIVVIPVTVGLSGTLTGNGTLTMNGLTFYSRQAVIYGTLAPSGMFTINGNLGLASSATTLSNVTPQGADKVEVSGRAALAGRLQIIMTGTFTPGTQFSLVHSGGPRSNFFDSTSIKYEPDPSYQPTIIYDANNVYLYLAPTGRD
ncbi:MAG: hypothetical protein M3Y80_11100 [Verrucomicrobiota bacterium]|nr:hypothetical protein [Verrucomicrobiota bacterium]